MIRPRARPCRKAAQRAANAALYPSLVAAWLLLCAIPSAQAGQEPDLEQLGTRALHLLNAARREAGLDELRPAASLIALAAHHSAEQAARGQVSHHSDEFNLSSERRIRIAFPRLRRFAENIARNGTVERLHAALLRSPGHRRNRLDPRFTHVGIAIARRGEHMLYLTEIFATAGDDELDRPIAFYFDAAPGTFEPRDDPRVERGTETFTVGPPGPDNPEFWTNLGINAFFREEFEGAAEHFRKALELEPDYDFAQYNLARALLELGQHAAAVRLLDGLLATDPNDLAARATRGSAALLTEDYAGAAAAFRAVLAERPRDAASWYNLGLALEYQDLPADAAAAYRQALHLDASLVAAQVGLGRVLRR